MTTTTLAVLVPLLPFLGAAGGLLLGRTAPGYVRPLAVLPTLTSAGLALLVAVRQGGGRPIEAATGFTPTGSVPIDLAVHLDGLAVLVAVLVGLVASCVQIYSTGYLREDPRYPSYAALVSLFTSAMLLVVYSGDLMVLMVGWEVMGICSYFLIGHHWETPEARAASLKAFVVTKLGDVPFLIGLFALAADAGSFRITTVLGTAARGGIGHPTLVALLLLAGVAGKSAQFPLHTWLPDAMAGPTPVSALIHAATMVAAGVYVIARLLPVFTASTAALLVLAVMAAVTMTGSALAALAQDDIKRVLAYSTIGQLGYMTGALAVGDRAAAAFHLLAHGAFKALLFLAAGVITQAAGTNSLTAMARMRDLRSRVPDAYWTMTAALLALAALPPFSGFFSKEAVLGAAERAATAQPALAQGDVGLAGAPDAVAVPSAAGWIVLVGGLIAALLTGAYATRLWLLAFHGRSATDGLGSPAGPARPGAMNAVLWVLAVPSLTLGLVTGMLHGWLGGPALAPILTTSVLGTGVSLLGCLTSYGAWRHARTRAAARVSASLATSCLPNGSGDQGAVAAPRDPVATGGAPNANRTEAAQPERTALATDAKYTELTELTELAESTEQEPTEPTEQEPVEQEAVEQEAVEQSEPARQAERAEQAEQSEQAEHTEGIEDTDQTERAGQDTPANAISAYAPAHPEIPAASGTVDPGRLLLGPLHRHAARGFHLDALYTLTFAYPVRAAAGLVRFLDREVVETYVRGAGAVPRWLGAAVRRAQTGNVQTYMSAMLAGAAVLAIAVILVATAGA